MPEGIIKGEIEMENKEDFNCGNRGYHEPSAFNLLNALNSQCINLKKRDVHLLPIGENNFLWIIISGWMLALRGDAQGRLKGTELLGPGDILGISGLAGNTRQVPVYALNNVLLKRIATKDFRKLMDTDIQLCRYMMMYMSRRYAGMLNELEQCALMTLEERIEAFRAKVERLRPSNSMDVPETIVAWAVGAHPVSVCRVLKGNRRY